MNEIAAKICKTPYDYEECYWFIDDKSLPEYLSDWAKESVNKDFKAIGSIKGLCPAWNTDIEWEGDVQFVWKAIDMDSAVVPLLLCPEDTDFSCLVIVAEVEKTADYVYWNRIGYVLHDNESFEEEKKRGILYVESYTDEDWEKYGDNMALERVNSPEWYHWISENWTEELYRRRMNYTLPYYQTEGNICWIKTTDWMFKREEYEKMVDSYWDMQVLSRIEEIDDGKLLYKESWAKFITSLTRNGRILLEQHIKDYDGILLHVLVGDLIGMPLADLLKNPLAEKRKIQIYCKAVECMWRYGNEEVVNVVDVTILEYLSGDENVWKTFGKNISNEFIKYINKIRGKHE